MLIILPHEANRQRTLNAHKHEEIPCMKTHFLIYKGLNQRVHIIRRTFENSLFTKESNINKHTTNS